LRPSTDESHLDVSREGSRIVIRWVPEDPIEVEEARRFFVRLTREGWLAAKHNGELRRILEFKPEYGELWFIPLSEGG